MNRSHSRVTSPLTVGRSALQKKPAQSTNDAVIRKRPAGDDLTNPVRKKPATSTDDAVTRKRPAAVQKKPAAQSSGRVVRKKPAGRSVGVGRCAAVTEAERIPKVIGNRIEGLYVTIDMKTGEILQLAEFETK